MSPVIFFITLCSEVKLYICDTDNLQVEHKAVQAPLPCKVIDQSVVTARRSWARKQGRMARRKETPDRGELRRNRLSGSSFLETACLMRGTETI